MINSLRSNQVFVFGSNEAGIHGAGAARTARQWGAEMGVGYGLSGNTFAIPTKDRNINTLPLNRIREYVNKFLEYAAGSDAEFLLTPIGTGLAGYSRYDIAPMFCGAPSNVIQPTEFQISYTVIGDVHGSDAWKDYPLDGLVVFVGDYFDSFYLPLSTQLKNFAEIKQFRDANKDRVKLLLGNHDAQYLGLSKCSGYQVRGSLVIAESLEGVNDCCFRIGDGWISHAGIGKEWLDTLNGEDINESFRVKPSLFNFNPLDTSGYGMHPSQGCLWIRPEALAIAPAYPKQIFGHTYSDRIEDLISVDGGYARWYQNTAINNADVVKDYSRSQQ